MHEIHFIKTIKGDIYYTLSEFCRPTLIGENLFYSKRILAFDKARIQNIFRGYKILLLQIYSVI